MWFWFKQPVGEEGALRYDPKQRLRRRLPPEISKKGSLYLAVIESPKTAIWYKKQRLGIHSIEKMMTCIVESIPVVSSG